MIAAGSSPYLSLFPAYPCVPGSRGRSPHLPFVPPSRMRDGTPNILYLGLWELGQLGTRGTRPVDRRQSMIGNKWENSTRFGFLVFWADV